MSEILTVIEMNEFTGLEATIEKHIGILRGRVCHWSKDQEEYEE